MRPDLDDDLPADVVAAESALDRIDRAADDEIDDRHHDLDARELADMHVEGEGIEDLDEAEDVHVDGEVASAIDTLADAFNARDLDTILELLRRDVEAPGWGDGLEDGLELIWERSPSCVLVRGTHEMTPVGVIFELGDTGWVGAGVVHVDDVVDGRIGVLELSEDVALLETVEVDPPDGELEEGARWEEWDEGVD